MCVVSMIMDHYDDEWNKKYILPQQPSLPPPTPQEIDEFRRLLERARQYDKEHNEPDCELESKKQKLKDLAKELGVDIDFVDTN